MCSVHLLTKSFKRRNSSKPSDGTIHPTIADVPTVFVVYAIQYIGNNILKTHPNDHKLVDLVNFFHPARSKAALFGGKLLNLTASMLNIPPVIQYLWTHCAETLNW